MNIKAVTELMRCFVLNRSLRLLAEKRTELGEQVSKLQNGLLKISDTREKVEAMSVELGEARTHVSEFQKECDDYLSVIIQQKMEADKQQRVSLAERRHETGLHARVPSHAEHSTRS